MYALFKQTDMYLDSVLYEVADLLLYIYQYWYASTPTVFII